MQDTLDQIKALKIKLYNLKTKKAINKTRDLINDLRSQVIDTLYDQRMTYNQFSIKGTVRYQDSETIAINTVYGVLNVYKCNDVLSKSWYSNTCCIEYSDNQEVVIECEVDIDMDQLKLVIKPKRTIGGKVNELQYKELCKNPNLAFFKYTDDTMSGLFK